MADIVDPPKRSLMMAWIRSKDTRPELALRRRLHRAGLRYRLHSTRVAGRPDIVLSPRRIAIFVHGCFWHRHDGCRWCSTPGSNAAFWNAKFDRNKARDVEVVAGLRADSWRVAIIWECGLRGASLDETTEALLAWIRSGGDLFESRLVRPQGAARRPSH